MQAVREKPRTRMVVDNDNLENLRTLREFVVSLRSGVKQTASQERIAKLGGFWDGTPEITEEDIAEARREMWGR